MDRKRLYTPSAIRESIERGGLRLTKSLGQNFLCDGNVVRNIAETAGIGPDDVALEIGPGIGTLTEELAYRAGKVIAVEIDRHLIPVLQENLAPYPHVHLVHADILKTDIPALLEEHAGGRPVHVVANLPYYITTPILTHLLETEGIASITAMVQKEVAERIAAPAGSAAYGSLSVFAQLFATIEIALFVPPTVFIPPPKVGSAVLHLKDIRRPAQAVPEMFAFVRKCFGQRRKTLANAASADGTWDKHTLQCALESLGHPADVRAQALTPAEFQALWLRLIEDKSEGV